MRTTLATSLAFFLATLNLLVTAMLFAPTSSFGPATAAAESVVDTTELSTPSADPSNSNHPTASATKGSAQKANSKTPPVDDLGDASPETGKNGPGSRVRIVDEAATALRTNPPLYVDPRAQLKLTPAEQDQLIGQIRASGNPIFVAVLPSQAGRPTVVTQALAKEVDKPGVYVTIVGVVYSAYATDFDAKRLLIQAFSQERNNGQAAVLGTFVDLVAKQYQGESLQPKNLPVYFTFIVIAMVLALPAILLFSAKRNQKK